MRVKLIHNRSAGTDDHSTAKLFAWLRAAGHTPEFGAIDELRDGDVRADLVLVAGGDGTVRKAVFAMLRSEVPMAILPLGTANNLARSLDCERPAEEIIANLHRYETRRLDIGSATGPWGECVFLEGFGVGLFADYLAWIEHPSRRAWAEALREEQGMTRDYVFLPQLLEGYSARGWELRVDGENVDGEYFLVEALNTTCVGPFSGLVRHANPTDGLLHLVALGESELAAFRETLGRRAAGEDAPFSVPTRTFRNLELRSRDEFIHFDDHLWPKPGEHTKPATVHVRARPAGPRFLCPPRASGA